MKVKSKTYIADIQKVKSMPRSKERRELAEKLAVKHNTSYDTIMRDARKKVSKIGVRKKRTDAGIDKVKPGKKDMVMYNELIKAGKTKAEAIAVIAEENNKNISERTKTKMSKKLETVADTDKTLFGSEVKEYVEKVWKLDKIAPGKMAKVKLDKKVIAPLTKNDIDIIKTVTVVAINRAHIAHKYNIPYDGDALLREMLKLMLQEQMFIVMENNNLNAIGQISLVLDRLDLATDIKNCTPNFRTYYKTLLHFDPTMTIDKAVALAERFKSKED